MMSRMRIELLASALMLSGSLVGMSASVACSHCAKDIMSEEESDAHGWQSSRHVFVATVVATRLDETKSRIDYDLRAEEVFKGNPALVTLSSSREVPAWSADRRMVVLSCGYASIAAGDRLVVFADDAGIVNIGRCSWTRVIEGTDAPQDPVVERLLNRLRKWSAEARTQR